MIADPLLSFAVVTPYDGSNPAGRVAQHGRDFVWRVALLHLPQNVPMSALDRLAGFSVPLVELFCCQLGFHFDSFRHTSIIRYLNGLDIIP